MSAPVELQVPPDVRYVGLVRLVVCAAARQAGLDEERTEDLRIAVSEATANAIRAHHDNDTGEAVCLRFGPRDGTFEVTVTDCGAGFEPGLPVNIEERDWALESGLGVTLIRGLTDAAEFVRGEGMDVHLRFSMSLDDGVAAGSSQS